MIGNITFDHLDIVRNEVDAFLDFQAGMTGVPQDQASRA
jgi:hypothetical protein